MSTNRECQRNSAWRAGMWSGKEPGGPPRGLSKELRGGQGLRRPTGHICESSGLPEDHELSPKSDNVRTTILARLLIAMRARMRAALISSILSVLLGCPPAVAQVVDTTPGIGTTSPPGMTAGTSVPPTGFGMGATELPSTGLSPVPTGSIGISGNGVACPTLASSSTGMSGNTTTYDGGGMTMGMPSPSGTTTVATCGTGSTSSTASSAMSTSTPGLGTPSGIPLGSVEIGNGGLSPVPTSPMPSPMPLITGASVYPSMMAAPTTYAPAISAPGPTTPPLGIGGPCQAIGSASPSLSTTGC
jgi:hypothetical protein